MQSKNPFPLPHPKSRSVILSERSESKNPFPYRTPSHILIRVERKA